VVLPSVLCCSTLIVYCIQSVQFYDLHIIVFYLIYIMIRRFIKPAYSHAPWKNPKYPPSCMCKGKLSPAKVLDTKVLGSEATTADKVEAVIATETLKKATAREQAVRDLKDTTKAREAVERELAKLRDRGSSDFEKIETGVALMVVPSIAQRWNTFPLIAGFTTFFKILKIWK
jgi:hypothetical protein